MLEVCYDRLSSKVLPKTKSSVVSFEWIQKVKEDPLIQNIDPKARYIPPPNVTIPGSYDFYDPESNEKIKLHNYVTTKLDVEKDGKEVERWVIDSVKFPMGTCTVDTKRDKWKFYFLALHPRNASNKYRDKNKEPLFETKVNQFRSNNILNLLAEEDLKMFAQQHVKELDYDQRRQLAASINKDRKAPVIDVNTSSAEIQYNLRVYAQREPRYLLERSADPRAVTKLLVSDAKQAELIELDITKGWLLKGSKSPFKMLATKEEKDDPLQVLVEYLLDEEGSKIRQKLEKELEPTDENWI